MNRTSIAQQANSSSLLPPAQGILQRKCSCGNHTLAGGECSKCRKQGGTSLQNTASSKQLINGVLPIAPGVQRSGSNGLHGDTHNNKPGMSSNTNQEISQFETEKPKCGHKVAISVDEILRHAPSKGASLELSTRHNMEDQFGSNFDSVRIHTDQNARRACKHFDANAFTIGEHIFIDPSRQDINSEQGMRLLSHELTHVVQQRGHGSFSLHSTSETQTLENEADHISKTIQLPFRSESNRTQPSRKAGNLRTIQTSNTHPGVLLSARRSGENYRDCINRRLGEMGLEIHIGWIVIGLCGIVAAIAGAAGAEAGVIPPAVLAAAACLALATGVEIGILAEIIWSCR